MNSINNFIQINDYIATSGQPTASQFQQIAKEGYEIVINLALNDSEGALKDEDKVVTKLGMTYIHIPVDFEYPTEKNLLDFIELLESVSHKKVWVHCILNHRVSAFMYVFHKYILRTPFEDIDLSVLEDWGPDMRWQNLMKIDIR